VQIRAATHGHYAVGHPRFQAETERALGRRATKGKGWTAESSTGAPQWATRPAMKSWSVSYPSLSVILLRSIKGHFTPDSHFAFEGVAWYWHFVDVVWLALFVSVYWL
jgi:Cytochrome c oxidase subunit III